MSFVKDMEDHDLSLLQTLDGQDIIHVPKSGKQKQICAMLQEIAEMVYGGNVDIVSAQPILSVRKKDMEDAEIGDNIVANGVSYRIAVIKQSSEGIIDLVLEKA